MNRSAPRSIDQYLKALREELAGEDAALIQDALYDAEEYLRAEVAAHPDKSESDVLELISSTSHSGSDGGNGGHGRDRSAERLEQGGRIGVAVGARLHG